MPSYGSINEINLKIKLDGGIGEASFQPNGFSRPNSYCKGNPFTPPRNIKKSLEYIEYKKHYEDKEQWEVETIRRAVVTYEFSAKVRKQTAYIIDNDKKIPELVSTHSKIKRQIFKLGPLLLLLDLPALFLKQKIVEILLSELQNSRCPPF